MDGVEVYSKEFAAPEIAFCVGAPCKHDPEVADAAFLRDAAINLKRGGDQVQLLRRERVSRLRWNQSRPTC